jgi:hypothetical protein
VNISVGKVVTIDRTGTAATPESLESGTDGLLGVAFQ